MPYKNKEYKRDYMERYMKQYRLDNKRHITKYNNQWNKDHRDHRRQCKIERLYGLSHKNWLKMWEDQNGRCKICGENFTKPGDANVDHNHKTGKIRGLICRKCNLGLGNFNDDPELLIKASKYLKKY